MMASSTPMAHHCLRPENAQIVRLEADGGGHELSDMLPASLPAFQGTTELILKDQSDCPSFCQASYLGDKDNVDVLIN